MATVVEEILKDCVAQALTLPRDPIQADLITLALGFYNQRGQVLWMSWPFHQEKVDEFTATSDASGIITFASTVEAVRAIRAVSASADADDTPYWAQDEVLAAAAGEAVSDEAFIPLADSGGCRRIKVSAASTDFKILALSRWVPAVEDDDYDPTDPTATPTDYRVATFPLERAEPALRALIMDDLRTHQGMPATGEGPSLLALAVRREQETDEAERRVQPRSPMFSTVGDWL